MEFFQEYKDQIIYIVIVVLAVILLIGLTNFLHKKFVSRANRKFPREGTGSLQLVKRILNSLWLVLGGILIFYLSTPEDSYTLHALAKDFKLIIYLGLVAVATIVGASSSNIWFRQTIQKRRLTSLDTTSLRFLRYMVVVGIYFIGLLLGIMAFPSLRGIAQTALGGAGIIAVIAGFAAQEALANVVSGLFIIAFKPFKVGDVIELEDTKEGTVVDITLRHTVIRGYDNRMIVIPNSIINKEKLVNSDLGDSRCCERIEIGISYNSDIDFAKKILQEECENHPLILDNRTEEQRQQKAPIVKTAIRELGDYAIKIRAWAWVQNYSEMYQLRYDVYESVKKRFDKEGIEIPFPYHNVVLKKEEKS